MARHARDFECPPPCWASRRDQTRRGVRAPRPRRGRVRDEIRYPRTTSNRVKTHVLPAVSSTMSLVSLCPFGTARVAAPPSRSIRATKHSSAVFMASSGTSVARKMTSVVVRAAGATEVSGIRASSTPHPQVLSIPATDDPRFRRSQYQSPSSAGSGSELGDLLDVSQVLSDTVDVTTGQVTADDRPPPPCPRPPRPNP